MNSESLHVRVQYLEKKVMQLLVHYKGQQEIIYQLQKEKEQLTERRTKLQDFSNSREMGTIAKAKGDTKNWEAQIDSYINDINKSITYLEQQL